MLLQYYQNIPSQLDPTAIAVGPFSIGWYALMYLAAFAVVLMLLLLRIRKKEGSWTSEEILDLFIFSLVGALVGGRLGYALLYNPTYYFHNPSDIFFPYDFTSGRWVGIYGMSYHGGLLGIILGIAIFSRRKNSRKNFWSVADFVAPAVPAGYFFGRIGNFLNGELYGRMTSGWIGMHFPLAPDGGLLLRYPSQLIEAFLEGFILFFGLWLLRNKAEFPGYLASLYLIGYGFLRILGEFFREPDEHLGFVWGYFTLGQLFSGAMVLAGAIIYFHQRKKVL